MMNFHHELGSIETDDEEIRFCQHINGACFWLSINPKDKSKDSELYVVETEDIMNAVLNSVMESRTCPASPDSDASS